MYLILRTTLGAQCILISQLYKYSCQGPLRFCSVAKLAQLVIQDNGMQSHGVRVHRPCSESPDYVPSTYQSGMKWMILAQRQRGRLGQRPKIALPGWPPSQSCLTGEKVQDWT